MRSSVEHNNLCLTPKHLMISLHFKEHKQITCWFDYSLSLLHWYFLFKDLYILYIHTHTIRDDAFTQIGSSVLSCRRCVQSQLSKLPCLKITEEWKSQLDAPHIRGGWHNSTGFSSLSTTKVSFGHSGNYPFKDKTDRLIEHVIMQQVLSCPPN